MVLLLAPFARAQDEAPPEPKKPTVDDVPALLEQMKENDYAGKGAMEQIVEVGPPAVPLLVRALKSKSPRVRYWSIAALSGIGGDEAREAILGMLDDRAEFVRSVAVWHLRRWIEHEKVRKAVLGRLEDKSALVRGWVLKVIQQQELADAAESVRKTALEDKDAEVRYDALATYTRLKGADALPLLTEAWRKDDEALVREGAVRCCTLIQPPAPATGDLLIRALRDKDPGVAETAATLLRKGFNQFFAFDPEAPIAQRHAAIRDWRNWYEAHKDELKWNEEKRRFEIAPPEDNDEEDDETDATE
jgi:HEAT repeat protein